MAGGPSGGDDDLIVGINVTPLVDVTLVLLIIFIVTARIIVTQSLPMDLPKAATGSETQTVFSIDLGATGEVAVDSALVTALMEAPAVPARLAVLSDREREVLALMAEGLTDRGIAERLAVSPKTVGTHIQHIFDRLGIADSPADNRRVHAVLSYLEAV